jgi:GT2 family glycosyltransferase
LLVKAELFHRLGGFDREFFMYADEADLGWRLTLAGARTITVHEAIVHHRGSAAANPKGGEKVVEFRTNEMVRYFATRNSLLVLLKNARHLLLVLALTQCLWVAMEASAVLVFSRRWRTVQKIYGRAFADLWRLRHHIRRERSRIASFRRQGDLGMLRFFRLRPGRLNDFENFLRLGPPKVNPAKF